MKRILLIAIVLTSSLTNLASAEDFVLDSANEGLIEKKLLWGPSRLSFDLVLEMPVSEDTVPKFFLESNGNYRHNLFKLSVSDEQCTGEYEVMVSFRQDKNKLITHYFELKVPWPEAIELKLEANRKSKKGFHHTLTVNGESKDIFTYKKIKQMALHGSGKAEVFDLSVEKMEKES